VPKTQRPDVGGVGPKLEVSSGLKPRPSSEIAKPAQALPNEQQIQRAVFQNIRARSAPGVFAFHPANGGYRRPIEAKILQGLGVTSGVPDIIAIKDGRCYALELKREGGRVSGAQLACLAAMERAGAFTAVADGLDRALACLEAWGLLRGRSS
jgi:hypothetical protein